MYEFKFPDVAEGLVEGKLIKWEIKEGDFVKEDDVVCEMETDKSVLDITCPKHGTVIKLHHKEGEMVKVHDVLVTLDTGDSPDETTSGHKEELKEESKEISQEQGQQTVSQPAQKISKSSVRILPKHKKLAKELGIDYTNLVGTGKDGRITEGDIRSKGKAQPIQRSQEQTKSEEHFQPHITEQITIKASPSMRKHARELGVSVDELIRPSQQTVSSQETTPEPIAQNSGQRQPIEGIRDVIKKKMTQAWTIPHASITFNVPVDRLIKERQKNKEQLKEQGIKLTYMAYITKVVAAALKEFPHFNSSLDETTNELVFKKEINVGIAVDTENGLIVPNIKGCDKKSILTIAKEISELSEKAKSKKISLDEIKGGTFTITNLGSFGAATGFSIINSPEVAILSVGKIFEKLELEDNIPIVKHFLPLVLAIDHRVLDGADAGRFLNYLAAYLSDPSRMLLEVV